MSRCATKMALILRGLVRDTEEVSKGRYRKGGIEREAQIEK
jgi:hypothetical protein